ncbi:MAG: O-antigen ligase family protein [Bacteroidota bacterium]
MSRIDPNQSMIRENIGLVGLIAILIVLPFGGFSIHIGGKTPEILFADVIVFLLAGLLFARIIRFGRQAPLNRSVTAMVIPIILLLIFGGIAVFNLPFSADPSRCMARILNVVAGPLLAIMAYCLAAGNSKTLKVFSSFIPLFSCYLAVAQFITLFITTGSMLPNLISRNTAGVFACSLNYTAALMLFLAVVSGGLYIHPAPGTKSLLAGFGYAAGFSLTLISGSRGGFIALILGTAFLSVFLCKKDRYRLLGLVLLAVLISTPFAVAAKDVAIRTISFLVPNAPDVTFASSDIFRTSIWELAWAKFLRQPVFGVGFDDLYVADLGKSMPAHSAVLELLLGVGLFGLIVYLAIGFCFMNRMYHWRNKPLAASLLASLAALAASVAIQPFLTTGRALNLIMGIVIGLGLRVLDAAREEPETMPKPE